MTDHELLLAISNMLDTKLKAELQAVKEELREDIRALGAELHEEIQMVRAELHREIQAVRAELHREIQAVRTELYGEIQSMRADLQEVKTEQQTLKEEVHCLKLYQENVIMPRLNTIELCYTGTYRRYACYVEKMEAVFQDVEVLKVVVAGHSEQLKKLA